jgi:RimJ/RimL family protein N-acetyltransferase
VPLTDGVIALRPFVPDDADAVAHACADPDIPRWTFMTDGLTPDQARDWIERAHEQLERGRAIRLAIVDAGTGAFLGQVGVGHLDWDQLVGEVFYWVAAPVRGRGFASRAARMVTDWAFATLDLARIEITVDPDNHASQRVAEAAGFTREGILRSYQVFKGGRMDAVMYSRLPADP